MVIWNTVPVADSGSISSIDFLLKLVDFLVMTDFSFEIWTIADIAVWMQLNMAVEIEFPRSVGHCFVDTYIHSVKFW